MADNVDPAKRFRLVSEEAPMPAPPPQDSGQPPPEPPKAPPMAASPVPEPDKKKKPLKKYELEERVRELEKENEQLVCALYFLQQEVKELRSK